MSTIQTFVDVRLSQIRQELRDLSDTLAGSLALFADQAVWSEDGGWKYELQEKDIGKVTDSKPNSFSQGTTSMISCALLILSRSLSLPIIVPSSHAVQPNTQLFKTTTAELLARVDASMATTLPHLLKNGAKSSTFGPDDPLTLFWLSALAFHVKRDFPEWTQARDCLVKAMVTVAGRRCDAKFDTSKIVSKLSPVDHAFPSLRELQTTRVQDETKFVQDSGGSVSYFEPRVMKQITFSEVDDSRFDPAELAFAFEGLLLASAAPLPSAMTRRFFKVMKRAQKDNAYWRPVTPILAGATGAVLYPVSVEVALSLLRICHMIDEKQGNFSASERCKGLFERYWQWLRSRVVTFKGTTSLVTGWHSEHVNEPKKVHLWETSQVILFMIGYQSFLTKLASAEGARAGNLAVDGQYYRHDNILGEAALNNWRDTVKSMEPVTSLGPLFESYRQMGEELVEGRIVGHDPAAWSILLYGPPGTGKTTLAEEVANALGLRFITVTVSDFLADGSDVEARAKAVFEVLGRQENALVLFDEIDQLLLDRESKLYRTQDSLFQFLTPGMLTKINDVRKARRIIFVLATNYVDRIDPAIKRRGRVDRQILVLPPDRKARERIFRKEVPIDKYGDSFIKNALDSSFMLNFTDIRTIVQSVLLRPETTVQTFEQILIGELERAERSARLSAYSRRLKAEQPPLDEFLALLAMHRAEGETGIAVSSLTKADKALRSAAKALSQIGGLDAWLRRVSYDGPAEEESGNFLRLQLPTWSPRESGLG